MRQTGSLQIEKKNLKKLNKKSHRHPQFILVTPPTPLSLSMSRVSDEQCVMIMSVRKGKRLVARLLPLLPSPQATAVVMAIARNLPALAKKDKQDQVTTHRPVAGGSEGLSPAGGGGAHVGRLKR